MERAIGAGSYVEGDDKEDHLVAGYGDCGHPRAADAVLTECSEDGGDGGLMDRRLG